MNSYQDNNTMRHHHMNSDNFRNECSGSMTN